MQIIGQNNIKKVSLLLRTMLRLKKKYGYSDEKTINLMKHFDKKLNSIYCDDSEFAEVCNVIVENDVINGMLFDLPFYNSDQLNYITRTGNNGGSVLSFYSVSAYSKKRVISFFRELINDVDFDLDRIDELVSFFDLLVNLGISMVTLNEKELIWIPKIYATIPNDSLNNMKISEIYKAYSDVPIIWKKFFDNDLNTDNENLNIMTGTYKNNPSWVIYGQVQYNIDKSLYLGPSSPHTQFNCYSKTLYPDISLFPKKEDLYSSSPVKLLKK